MTRSFDYARTAPEPPEGALVVAVRLVVAFMGRTYAGDLCRRQRVLATKSAQMGPNGLLNRARWLRHKLCHGRSQSFRTARLRRAGPARPAHHSPRHGANAGLHAGRHRRCDEGPALARGARCRRRYRARQYLSSDAATECGADRGPWRPAEIHGLARPDADRLRRLPGDVA